MIAGVLSVIISVMYGACGVCIAGFSAVLLKEISSGNNVPAFAKAGTGAGRRLRAWFIDLRGTLHDRWSGSLQPEAIRSYPTHYHRRLLDLGGVGFALRRIHQYRSRGHRSGFDELFLGHIHGVSRTHVVHGEFPRCRRCGIYELIDSVCNKTRDRVSRGFLFRRRYFWIGVGFNAIR